MKSARRVASDEQAVRLLIAGGLAVAVAVVSLTLDMEVYLSRVVSNGLFITCVALAAWTALRAVSRPLHRGGWSALAFGVGLAFIGCGDVTWAWYELVLCVETPFPSFADPFYVTGYLLMIGGVILLPTRPFSLVLRGRILLDGLLAVLSLATFSWYSYLGPVLLDNDATPLARAVGVCYPLIDIVLLACLGFMANHGGDARLHRAVTTLRAGLIVLIVADTFYGVFGLRGYYPIFLDVPFVLAFMLIGAAAADAACVDTRHVARDDTVDPPEAPTLWRLLLPYTLCLALGGLLAFVVLVENRNGALAAGVYGGAMACILVLLGRQMMALRENTRLYHQLQNTARQLQELAATDGMTGLANHRTMQETLRQEMDLQAQRGGALAVLLIDVDDFKTYNDDFGHQAGDDVLRQVAQVLRGSVRPGEVPARYGGEEFAVVLPGADAAAATRIAERIRIAVEIQPFVNRRITVSIGAACSSDPEVQPADLLHAADRALYEAKRAGRNRVIAADPVAAARRVA